MSEPKKKKKVFLNEPISPAFISESIAKHSIIKDIGAHSIFLGQVRNDQINEQEVIGIHYECYQELAESILHQIREDCFDTFELSCLHIYHSLGLVQAGEICLFVFTSSKHRKTAMDACDYLVERIKKEVPVWGKEIFSDSDSRWKINQ